MKIVLLALFGLLLGALGGAVLGIAAGLAWVEIFKTPNFEGFSGMLVFFTFMLLGDAIGGIGGALTFGLLAFRDDVMSSSGSPLAGKTHRFTGKPHLCNAKKPIAL